MTQEAQPLFDSSRKALTFALNHSRSIYSQPLMTKAANALDGPSEGPSRIRREVSLAGLDGAAQAGLVFMQLNKLPDAEITVLICRAALHSFPCSCRSACCMGVRPNPEWIDAIKKATEFVKAYLLTQEEKDKKRKKIQTNPQLRRMLVEHFFGRKRSTADLAETFQLSEGTVINHRAPIFDVLNSLEKSGWSNLDAYLTEIGMVGAMP